jgi:predicted enzyme related to lactoylglutathione lyase
VSRYEPTARPAGVRWILTPGRISVCEVIGSTTSSTMRRGPLPSRVVHLELHTADLRSASAFYSQLLCWREDQIDTVSGSYHALELGNDLGGGIVECRTRRASWLPYVEVDRVDEATDRACKLGAAVLLAPREGPAGWRSVVATPEAGEIALWQQKAWRR